MPSGNVTLLEAAKSGSDVLKRGVVETLIQESPILDQLPVMTISGNALKHRVEESLPTAEFRNVNETYNASWGTDTEFFWGTTILGGEVKVDNYLVNVMGNDEPVKARQYAKMAKTISRKFDKSFFDGTGTAKDFKGLKALIDEGHGQKLLNATGGGALSLDKMDEAHDLLRTGSADALLMNRTARRKLTTLARNISGQFPLIGTEKLFGKQVLTWNDIPIRLIGDDDTGSPILPYTEDPGDAGLDTTSIYFIRYGTDLVCGLLGLGGSMTVKDFGELQAAPQHLGRIEFYPGLAVFDKFAVVRLFGITNA